MNEAPKAGRACRLRSFKEKAMTYGSKFNKCAHCGNSFPVVEGRVQQWRVNDQYACNEFCAEGVEEKAQGRTRS
jgi:hypothetical protein